MAKHQLHSEQRKGQKVVLVHAGVTTFSEDGVTEVELEHESHLEDLLNSYPDITVAVPAGEAPLASQTEQNELGKSEDESNDIGTEEEDENNLTGEDATPDPKAELVAQLEALNMVDLKQLAQDSGFEAGEWSGLKKAELKAYLLEKL